MMLADVEIPEDAIQRLLDTWPVARLATAGPVGPHLVPLVFARAGGLLWSPVDAKPKRGGELARLRNVERDPRVSLLLDHYDRDWSRLWWIRVDGRARVVRGEVAEAVSALRTKYPQYALTGLLREPATLLAVRSERVSSWCAGRAALR
jgi:PPOX class probable F420-dependent enzyme